MSNHMLRVSSALLAIACLLAGSLSSVGEQPNIPQFRMQEIATDLKVGYAVLLVDVNGDGKKDIVVVDTTRVVWYENPTWKMRTILQGQTAPDNVCISAYDIDGDGQIDLALAPTGSRSTPRTAARSNGSNGANRSTSRGRFTRSARSRPSIASAFIDLDGSGKPALVLGPLMGRGGHAGKNWMDG